MSQHTYDSIQGQIQMTLFQEEIIRQANSALVNLQKLYDAYRKVCLIKFPKALFSCKSAEAASIEWIELLLVEAVVDYRHSRYNWADTKRCEDFSHHVITTLKDNGVETLLQLYQMTNGELHAIDHIGDMSVKYLRDVQYHLDTGEPGEDLPAAS